MQGANLLIRGDTVILCFSALQYFCAQPFSHTHEKAIWISSELSTLLKNMQLKLGESHRYISNDMYSNGKAQVGL